MIHLLPGMGADHRMYPAPWAALPNCRIHDWPAYHGEDSINLNSAVETQIPPSFGAGFR